MQCLNQMLCNLKQSICISFLYNFMINSYCSNAPISRFSFPRNISENCQEVFKWEISCKPFELGHVTVIYCGLALHINSWYHVWHRPRPYCSGVLAIASMDSHLFGISLMGISQPRCSTISTEFRRWFIEGNTKFEGEHFLIKTLKRMWVKKKFNFFYPRFLKGFYEKMGISFYKPVLEQYT